MSRSKWLRACWLLAAIAALAVGLPCASAAGSTSFNLTFLDPSHQWTNYYGAISNNLMAAAQNWAQYFNPPANITIGIVVTFSNSSTFLSSGFSYTSSFVTSANSTNIYEQGAGAVIRTGNHPANTPPDVHFEIGTNYLVNVVWWDPNPAVRADPVPADKTDSMSVCLHELCHAWAFNGWMNGTTGTSPGNYMSTFDRWVTFDGINFYFHGPRAMANYGGPVPVTYADPFHLGNSASRPGADLIPDLMNGVVFTNGTRYYISSMDLDVIADTGLPVVVPAVKLSQPQLDASSMLDFQVTGPVGRQYLINVSSDLLTWTALTNFVSTNTTISVQSAVGTNRYQFFRALLL